MLGRLLGARGAATAAVSLLVALSVACTGSGEFVRATGGSAAASACASACAAERRKCHGAQGGANLAALPLFLVAAAVGVLLSRRDPAGGGCGAPLGVLGPDCVEAESLCMSACEHGAPPR